MKRNLYLFLLHLFALFSFHSGAQVVTTIAGSGFAGYTGDGGAATTATLDSPSCIARDHLGNIYVADQNNNCIRKINGTTGIITTVAGNGLHGYSGDNGPATNAKLYLNWGVAVDIVGNLYISDQVNHRVRKVNTSGIITTILGTGADLSNGDGGPATAANIRAPMGITTDASGNVYVSDQAAFKIRKIDAAGIVTTYAGAGTPGYTGDGGAATNATLSTIFGLATDNAGNLFICDAGNNAIRKVNSSGTIATIAGIGAAGFGGDAGAATLAKLNVPTGVFASSTGELFIADCHNNRIRMVNTSGIISTVAGTGAIGFNGDGNSALSTNLYRPISVVIGDSATLYVSDLDNVRIRKISKILRFTKGYVFHMSVCENLASFIDSVLAITDTHPGLTDIWSIVSGPGHGGLLGFPHIATATSGSYTPSGLSYTPTSGYTGNDTFTISINNGLDTSQITVYINVDAALSFPGVITGPSDLCVGSTIALIDTVGGGTWSISNLHAIVSGGNVHGESPGLDTVIYTITNSCGTISTHKTITIHQLPDPGNISGQHELCIGSTSTLSASVGGGTWLSSDSSASISATGTLTAHSAGSGTVVYTVHDAYCMNKTFYSFTVDPIPTSTITVGQTSICIGTSTNITGIPQGGVWSVTNGNVAIQQDSVVGLAEGIDTITYTYTNFCGTAVFSIAITVNPSPSVPSVVQNESVISVPSGYTSYQWMLNGSNILGAVTDTYLVAETGLYSILVSNAFGCAAISSQVLCTGCTVDDIRLYPNPTTGLLNIKWCKKLTIRLLCMDGKEVKIFTDATQIDLSELPNADYILSIFDMDGNKLKTKIISKNTN